jgi:hypothetical protein
MPDPSSLRDPKPVSVPSIVSHGKFDTVVRLEPVRQMVQKLFTNVKYDVVEDDHRLPKSVHDLDWNSILAQLALRRFLINPKTLLKQPSQGLYGGSDA